MSKNTSKLYYDNGDSITKSAELPDENKFEKEMNEQMDKLGISDWPVILISPEQAKKLKAELKEEE